MKKALFILLLLSILISIFSMTGCDNNVNVTQHIVASADTVQSATVDIDKIIEENNSLKEELEAANRIYDNSLKNAVNTYCEKYLSYSGSATYNIDKVKNIVTESYYSELLSQLGHAKSDKDKDYEQSTGLDELYYAENSMPSDSIKVFAICKQTVIFDGEVKITDVIYTFYMNYENGIWKINSVDTAVTSNNLER